MKRTLFVVLLFYFVSGCASYNYYSRTESSLGDIEDFSVGNEFSLETTRKLVLGKSTKEDARSVFGEPTTIEEIEIDDHKYDIISYLYAKKIGENVETRTIRLEFKENVFNGYNMVTSFKDDIKSVNDINIPEFELEKSKAIDIERTLGLPQYKGLIPSRFMHFIDKDDYRIFNSFFTYEFNSPSNNPNIENRKFITYCFDKEYTLIG